ncbi:hypothetical protein EV193_111148 [Herbihabitans rhizosphaerae]|uniref:Uncharacterized protein n=1 Tax=Herbihabitans rhizosphaerae TaxID=1872711 RepID=A0A4Q7KFT9_9PSEU|nr:hypothetical protein [Herbihabitans rhizosphaerae]RZS32763.1 hypothetical protein EV193_111148 [Herbihabitans rhizosphaerae]
MNDDELNQLRQDTATALYLAKGADRDVAEVRSELRAHRSVLNALREDQVDLRHEMRDGFAKVNDEFAEVRREMRAGFKAHAEVINALREDQIDLRGEFAAMRVDMQHGFSTMSVGMAQITALLTNEINERDDD